MNFGSNAKICVKSSEAIVVRKSLWDSQGHSTALSSSRPMKDCTSSPSPWPWCGLETALANQVCTEGKCFTSGRSLKPVCVLQCSPFLLAWLVAALAATNPWWSLLMDLTMDMLVESTMDMMEATMDMLVEETIFCYLKLLNLGFIWMGNIV